MMDAVVHPRFARRVRACTHHSGKAEGAERASTHPADWPEWRVHTLHVTTRNVRLIRPPSGNSDDDPNRIRSTP